eukprot:6194566-Pleurochrysis_carterae.AAC.2
MQDGCDDCDFSGFARARGLFVGTIVAVISIILFALSWDTVEPTEFGLVQVTRCRSVDEDCGRHTRPIPPDDKYQLVHTSHLFFLTLYEAASRQLTCASA